MFKVSIVDCSFKFTDNYIKRYETTHSLLLPDAKEEDKVVVFYENINSKTLDPFTLPDEEKMQGLSHAA